MSWIGAGSAPKRHLSVATPKQSLELPISVGARGIKSASAILENLTQAECRFRSVVFLDLKSPVEFELSVAGKPKRLVRGQVTSRTPSGPYFAYSVAIASASSEERDELVSLARSLQNVKPMGAVRESAGFGGTVQFPIFYRTAFEGPRQARAARISITGMSMTCSEALVEGMAIEVTFTLPNAVLDVYEGGLASQRRPFRQIVAQARVVAHRPMGNATYEYGIEFRGLELADREEIARYEHALKLAKRVS